MVPESWSRTAPKALTRVAASNPARRPLAAAAPNAPAVAVRKKPQRARRRNPEMACDVDPESECGQEVASPDAALAFGPREGRGNGNGEGVDDRAPVHAVKLRVVDLVGVTYSRPGRGEARAVRPDPRMIAGARETLGLESGAASRAPRFPPPPLRGYRGGTRGSRPWRILEGLRSRFRRRARRTARWHPERS